MQSTHYKAFLITALPILMWISLYTSLAVVIILVYYWYNFIRFHKIVFIFPSMLTDFPRIIVVFTYMGAKGANINHIHEERMNTLHSGSASCDSVNPLKSEFLLNSTRKLILYLTGNTLCICYKVWSINVVPGINPCLLCEPYEIYWQNEEISIVSCWVKIRKRRPFLGHRILIRRCYATRCWVTQTHSRWNG
jgi:hypothetical protein